MCLRRRSSSISWRKHILQPRPSLFILRHAHVERVLRPLFVDKPIESRLRQRSRHLPGAVRSEIVENHRVVAANRPDGSTSHSVTLPHHKDRKSTRLNSSHVAISY